MFSKVIDLQIKKDRRSSGVKGQALRLHSRQAAQLSFLPVITELEEVDAVIPYSEWLMRFKGLP